MFEQRKKREVNLIRLEMPETKTPNWRSKNGCPGKRNPKKGMKKKEGGKM